MSRSYSSLLSWFFLALLSSLMLYHTSDRVNALHQRLHGLEAQIDDERKSIHVLNAEWVYLANPARIEAAARRHLGLQPTAPKLVAGLKDLALLLPLHDGAPATAAIADNHAVAPPAAAAATQPTATPSTARVATIPAHPSGRAFAAIGAGRLNGNLLTHAAAVSTSTASIGALIGSLRP